VLEKKIKKRICMKIVIGADHRGFQLKKGIQQQLMEFSGGKKIQWIDAGCFSAECCDYPLVAREVIKAMRNGRAELGILLCGTGAGMAIMANRFAGIYASLVWTPELARLARQHDNANVLVLPADYVTVEQSVVMIQSWLEASFAGGRHQRRIDEIDVCGGL
jgi:ribose 5-phosphate isomerase B